MLRLAREKNKPAGGRETVGGSTLIELPAVEVLAVEVKDKNPTPDTDLTHTD